MNSFIQSHEKRVLQTKQQLERTRQQIEDLRSNLLSFSGRGITLLQPIRQPEFRPSPSSQSESKHEFNL